MNGLAAGLPRYRGDLGRMSLVKLLRTPPPDASVLVPPIRRLNEKLRGIAGDDDQSLTARVGAIELLALEPFDKNRETYARLLQPGRPTELQRAEVFRLSCAACHQARGEGHRVGPDITDVRNRSAEAILTSLIPTAGSNRNTPPPRSSREMISR